MPNYGSLHSPSLKKYNNMAEYRRSGRFDFGNIIGDPFALATISIGLVCLFSRHLWSNLVISIDLRLTSLPG